MRNKFTELVNAGVASRPYQEFLPKTSCSCPICRAYNNIFGMPTDTHMSALDDGTYVITGHMICTPDWEEFVTSYGNWKAVSFKSSGYEGFEDFLFKHNLEIDEDRCSLNGDCAVFLKKLNIQ